MRYSNKADKFFALLSTIVCILMLSASLTFAAERKPVEVKLSDKCPVCGMFVAKYKNWQAQIHFADGSYAVFDGPKDMFRYLLDLKKYDPSKKVSDIANVYATEYYAAQMTDARKLFYVQGSNVMGPMGAELVPLASEAKAKEFLTDHKGKKVLKFNEVTGEYLK